MDIFNKKKVAELERELAATRKSRDEYMRRASDYATEFIAMSELKETIPEDCVRGPWCEACEFVKTFHVSHYYGFVESDVRTAYVCGKGKSCNNFVQKKFEGEN